MGMFDYVKIQGREFQTKAFGRSLAKYTMGDSAPQLKTKSNNFIVEAIGENLEYCFIIVKDGVISGVSPYPIEGFEFVGYYGDVHS